MTGISINVIIKKNNFYLLFNYKLLSKEKNEIWKKYGNGFPERKNKIIKKKTKRNRKKTNKMREKNVLN